MSSEKTVLDFYKSEAFLSRENMLTFLHPEAEIHWHSTKGFLKLNHEEILNLTDDLSRAYVRLKCRISHVVSKKDEVAVRFSQYVKTIENPREELLLAHFMVIWELRDGKLYRGYQMSQL